MADNHDKKVKLPKPVTVVGSAVPQPPIEVEEPSISDHNQVSGVLPMPAAFGDDDEPEDETKTPQPNINDHVSPPAPMNNILPSPDDDSKQKQNDELGTPTQPEEMDIPKITDFGAVKDESDQSFKPMETPSMFEAQSSEAEEEFPQINPHPDTQIPEEISALNLNSAQVDQVTAQIPDFQDPNLVPPQAPLSDHNQQANKGGGKVLIAIGAILVGSGMVVGGYFAVSSLMGGGSQDSTPEVAYVEPTATPRPSLTPTPKPATESAKPKTTPKAKTETNESATEEETVTEEESDLILVKILNGSGVKGDAKKAQDLIDDLDGMDISTGNADNFAYEGLEIEYKDDYETEANNIASKLEDDYGKATLSDTLKDSNQYDIIVTLGTVE